MIEYRVHLFRSERPGRHGLAGGHSPWTPPVDVYETSDAVVVVMDLAGVRSDDIEIQADGRRLLVTGSRSPALREGIRYIHRLEIQHGRFRVEVELPRTVDHDRAEACSTDGLLEIVLPIPAPFRPPVTEAALEPEELGT